MANSKSDTRRITHRSSLAITEAQAAFNTNPDLERRVLANTLVLSGYALVSESINDLRILNGQRAADA